MIKASICTIGDEILIGQIVDTNSSMISRRLGELGIEVTRMLSISDNHKEIVESLRSEMKCNDIVIVTGGLGPTKDDITKPALAELFGCSVPTANRIKRSGIINDAITQIGRKIIVDAEKALILAAGSKCNDSK